MLHYALLGMGMLLAAAPLAARADSYSRTTTTSYFQPAQYRQAPGGEYCREFQRDIMVGGRMQAGYGTACLQPDGAWKFPDGSYAQAQGTGDLPWANAPVVTQTVRHDRYYDPYYDPYYRPRVVVSPPPMISFNFGDYGHRHHYRHYSPRRHGWYGGHGRGHGRHGHGHHRRRGWDGGRW